MTDLSGNHLDNDRPNSEPVDPRRILLGVNHLGSHIGRSPGPSSHAVHFLIEFFVIDVELLSEPNVAKDDLAVVVDQEVRGFEVPMDVSTFVQLKNDMDDLTGVVVDDGPSFVRVRVWIGESESRTDTVVQCSATVIWLNKHKRA